MSGANHFANTGNTILFNLYNDSMEWVLLFNPFYQRGTSGTERLSHLSEVAQQVKGRAGKETQAA